MIASAIEVIKPRREDMQPVGSYGFELPASWRGDMRVPVRVYADEALLQPMLEGEAMLQLVNVATLPGVVDHVYGMPDMHEGYGFPVGGVAATRLSDGVVSPGGVGFDINCGVRLMALPLTKAELGSRLEALVHQLSRSIPSGTGRGGEWRLNDAELDAVLTDGSSHLVRAFGLGVDDDATNTESSGRMDGADPSKVSTRAKDRGRSQLGSIGAGNHFVEVQVVESITDPTAAQAFGLQKDHVTVLIHTGSRGLGHQVCTDYVKLMDSRLEANGITLPDRQLSCAPIDSPEGSDYLAAMSCAANYAWSNRQRIAHIVRTVAVAQLGVPAAEIRTVYDVAHNIAKMESYGGQTLCVHRKGATRAFGPGSLDLPAHYRDVGQPVFIPGSMGTSSWVLVGDARAATESWGSACHGAGRALSRHAAKRTVTGSQLRRELEQQGIVVRCPTSSGLAEEAPLAYKDVDRVAQVVEGAGLARRVAQLRPLGVIKG
ncbi:MAG: RtcB family protein [Gemmatimonadaceae bacterium]